MKNRKFRIGDIVSVRDPHGSMALMGLYVVTKVFDDCSCTVQSLRMSGRLNFNEIVFHHHSHQYARVIRMGLCV